MSSSREVSSFSITSRNGQFNYYPKIGSAIPPPETVVLGTDDGTMIVTDGGEFIEVV